MIVERGGGEVEEEYLLPMHCVIFYLREPQNNLQMHRYIHEKRTKSTHPTDHHHVGGPPAVTGVHPGRLRW